MEPAQKRPRPHYAWVILIACCLIQGGTVGIVQNCRGIFYNFVCGDLGFEVSAFTLYSLFHGIGSFLFMPLSTRLADRARPRLVLLACLLMFGGSTALFGSMRQLAGFYLLGFVQGMGASLFTFYICPLLIGNWFKKHYGLAMGIYGAFSGLTGILANPLLNRAIESFGWRNGYRIQGLACLAFSVPAVLLIKAIKPADLGQTRLGETREEAAAAGAAALSAAPLAPATKREKRILAISLVIAVLIATVNSYTQHFSKYAATIGLSSEVGALLVSCAMASNLVFKFLLGNLNDRIGTIRTLLAAEGLLILGFLGMLCRPLGILYPSSFLAGLCLPLCATCVPMLMRHLFGQARFRKFYSTVTMVNALCSSFAIFSISLVYEIRYSYVPVFLLGAAMVLISAILMLIANRIAHPAREADAP